MGSGASSLNEELIKCKVWTDVEDPEFIYPEEQHLSSKADLGIAFAGGALRSATSTLGYLRALNQMGVLEEAKYIVSNSGATWSHTPFTFLDTPESIDNFLGKYYSPEKCTLQDMKIEHPGHSKLLAKSFTARILQHGLGGVTTDVWGEEVASAFFKKYDLHHSTMIPSIAQCQPDKFVRRCCNPNLPYPIMSGACTVSGDAYPVEFTPMYYGMPVRSKVHDEKKVGGFLMEPLAFCCDIPSQHVSAISKCITDAQRDQNRQVSDPYEVPIPPPSSPFSLCSMSAISSNVANGVVSGMTGVHTETFGARNVWNPYLPDECYNDELCFGDGGFFDNNAIISLLRRRVKNIIACYMNEMDMRKDLEETPSLPSLFGANREGWMGVPRDRFAAIKHVFPREEFDKLKTALLENLDRGEPLHYLMKTDVLTNKLCGVHGYENVSVLFICISTPTAWLDALPDDFRTCIREENNAVNDSIEERIEDTLAYLGGDADLTGFPNFPSSLLNYSHLAVNGMTNLATWSMLQAEHIIRRDLLPATAQSNRVVEEEELGTQAESFVSVENTK